MSTSPPGAGLTAPRRRLSDDEIRQRMLAAARDMVEESGLTVNFGHLSFEEMIQRAGVSRSGVYRLWPYKEEFFSELLIELAGNTTPGTAAYFLDTQKLALNVVAQRCDWLSTPEGRRELVIEVCRQGSQQNFQAMYGSSNWRTYVALTATLISLGESDIRKLAQEALRAGEHAFLENMSGFYRAMSPLLNYRIKRQFNEDYSILATLGGAVIEGMVLNSHVLPEVATRNFVARPFDTRQEAEWTLPSLAFTSIIVGLTEPDPEFDEDTVPELQVLLSQWLTSRDKIDDDVTEEVVAELLALLQRWRLRDHES